MGATRDGHLRPLSGAPVLLEVSFTAPDTTALRHEVARLAAAEGWHGERLDDFVFAVYELLTNAVRHGGGSGLLRLARVGDDLACQVDDDGPGFTPESPSSRLLSETGGRGLRLARELTDAMTITNRTPGTSVRIQVSRGPRVSDDPRA